MARLGNGGVGNARNPLYSVWARMLERCHDPETEYYCRYGGRGVSVCDRWRWGDGQKGGFDCFVEDMGSKPTPQHSVDRMDNDGGYSPENCRWATKTEQARNRRNVPFYELNGLRKTLPEWAEFLGVQRRTLAARLRLGWPKEDIFSIAVRSRSPNGTNKRRGG